jgi:nucleotide-binding universal stress UspA family protein
MKRILIATDASTGGRDAVEHGLDLARSSDASATVVYVRRAPRPFIGDPFYQRQISEGMHEANEAVGHALGVAAELGVEIDVEILEGDPASRIIELAQDRDVDLIVLGSRNRGPLLTALLGSVSTDVMAHADRPVLVSHPFAGRGRSLATA